MPSLVPRSWELVRRNAQRNELVVATNVASYDLLPDGSIVYSNGRAAFRLGIGTQPSLNLREDLVADLVARAGEV